jgi:hypothetical protein
LKISDDTQALVIKTAAVITATPRWVAALLAAEGLAIPAGWIVWWLPLSAVFSAAMAVVEGMAFAFVFSAWRNQQDKSAARLFWLALGSAGTFVGVLAPYIAASVRAVPLSEILSGPLSLGLWSSSVAASTIMIVVSVGYAQKASSRTAANPDLQSAKEAVKDLRKQMDENQLEAKRVIAEYQARHAEIEARAIRSEERFAAAGDLFARLFAQEKAQRILAASQQWPELPASAIAIIAEASPSYVSEVLQKHG